MKRESLSLLLHITTYFVVVVGRAGGNYIANTAVGEDRSRAMETKPQLLAVALSKPATANQHTMAAWSCMNYSLKCLVEATEVSWYQLGGYPTATAEDAPLKPGTQYRSNNRSRNNLVLSRSELQSLWISKPYRNV